MEAIIECQNCGHPVAVHGDDGCHEDCSCRLTQAQAAQTVPAENQQYEERLSQEE